MKTCVKCNRQHPHMVSLCADCHKQINKDVITSKRAAEIGVAFVANYHEVRATIKGWRDEHIKTAKAYRKEDGAIGRAEHHEYTAEIYERVLNELDNPA